MRPQITVNGKTLKQIAQETGLHINTIRDRYERGYDFDSIVAKTYSKGSVKLIIEGEPLKDVAKELGLPYSSARALYHKGYRTRVEFIEGKKTKPEEDKNTWAKLLKSAPLKTRFFCGVAV
jgi:transposase